MAEEDLLAIVDNFRTGHRRSRVSEIVSPTMMELIDKMPRTLDHTGTLRRGVLGSIHGVSVVRHVLDNQAIPMEDRLVYGVNYDEHGRMYPPPPSIRSPEFTQRWVKRSIKP